MRCYQSLGGEMHFGRQHFEVEALIVERGDGIANHLVGKFQNRFFRHVVPSRDFCAAEGAGQIGGGCGSQVENDPAFNIAGEGDLRRYAAALIRILRHEDFAHTGAATQALSQHCVGCIDEGLNQLHFHA